MAGEPPTTNDPSTGDTSVWLNILAGLGYVAKFVITLGGLIKQGTKHMPWDDANNQALVLANKFKDSTIKYAGESNAAKIGGLYLKKMIAYLQATDRWGEGYPQNKQAIIDLLKSVNPVGISNNIISATWAWAMWTLQNTDLDRPDDFLTLMSFDMTQTYVKAYSEIMGVSIDSTIKNVGTGLGVGSVGSGGGGSSGSIGSTGGSIGTTVTGIASSLGLSGINLQQTIILVAIAGFLIIGILKFKR